MCKCSFLDSENKWQYISKIYFRFFAMFIKHTNYEIGVHEISLSGKAAAIDLEEPFFGDVSVVCKMNKTSSQIVLECSSSVKARLICDRCNEEYETEIKSNFTALYFLIGKRFSRTMTMFFILQGIRIKSISRKSCGIILTWQSP